MSPFPQSTNVDWWAVDISRLQKDFPQILELVMWIRAIWFAVGAHVSIHSCDFTNGYFQGQQIDRILLGRILVKGIRELGVASGAILPSRVLVFGTTDPGRGLRLLLKNTCKEFQFSLNPIPPTLFTLRDDESRTIAVVSSNVDDFVVWLSS